MADKHYRGWAEDRKEWQDFDASDDSQATPEVTGYDKVEREDGTPVLDKTN